MKAMMKSWSVLLFTIMMALTLAGCGGDEAAPKDVNPGTPAQQEEEQNTQTPPADSDDELKTTYPLTVTDARGTEITFEQAPTKVASISPSETEKLFALGLDEEIVGVSDNDDYPEAAKDKPKLGGYQVNEEAIIAAAADVVFAASMNAQSAEELSALGVTLFVNDPKTIQDVMDNIELIGQITDRQKEAKAVVEQMKQELASVTEAVQSLKDEEKKTVYIEFSPGWTVGKGEFMDEVIALAGGTNAAGDQEGWFEISEENIIAVNPDVILYTDDVVDEATNKTLGEMIKERGGWDQIDAIKNDQVIAVNANLLSRPGPRITQGLIEVAKAVYPQLMNP
ncbi:ABC transporter substrate-binding protein [Paenibacillus sp. JCM 10914]|uniref:ABC transporter substrate-binding protein n=1 Tax=Paenibacillus sp. JCM 10914 TaxID=1236974 RepID=UPI0003CC88BE|nr:ABC transporter substrate-binding protein [Paenibacillus sp. JCM 10914]GAE05627.1 vitamin B12 ABC transporter, B12-binding component BtuF [Paenibacillus sp. JCM 10914]